MVADPAVDDGGMAGLDARRLRRPVELKDAIEIRGARMLMSDSRGIGVASKRSMPKMLDQARSN